MSSAAVVIGALRVNQPCVAQVTYFPLDNLLRQSKQPNHDMKG